MGFQRHCLPFPEDVQFCIDFSIYLGSIFHVLRTPSEASFFDLRLGDNQQITFSHLSCKSNLLMDSGNQHDAQNHSKINDLRSKLGHVGVMLALCWSILDSFLGYVAQNGAM